MTFVNGMIPTSSMTRLSVGGFLLPSAAGNFELWRAHAARTGRTLTITSAADAFRSYEIQERIFLERFTTTYLPGRPTKVWRGRVWWLKPGKAMAAVPGTSNHGKGVAVDVKDAGSFAGDFYRWMASTGPDYGWSNVEGRSIGEPWHWVNDNQPRGAISAPLPVIPRPTPTPTPAPPTSEEDDMFTDADRALLVSIRTFAETAMKAADIATNAANRAAEYADVAGKTAAEGLAETKGTRADVTTVYHGVRHVAAALDHPIYP